MPNSKTCKSVKIFFIGIFLISLSACEDGNNQGQSTVPAVISDDLITLNNLGVGQMGYFDYAAAHDTFSKVHEKAPNWRLAEHNLIIATLNRQHEGDEQHAIERLTAMLGQEKDDVTSQYLLGILLYNQGDCVSAKGNFAAVINQDPSDAYANYFLAQCELQLNELELAFKHFETASTQDSYLRSAYYGAFVTAQRLGLKEVATAKLADYSRLEMNPKARLAEIKYTRMGEKAMAKSFLVPIPKYDAQELFEPGNPFVKPTHLQLSYELNDISIIHTVGHQNTHMIQAQDNAIDFINYDTMLLESSINIPGISPNALISIADFNNDNAFDLYVTQQGRHDFILMQTQAIDGQFEFEQLNSEVMSASYSRSTIIFDADHDGDLDIATISEDNTIKLVNNNGNLTFKDITSDLIETTLNNDIQQIAVIDVDGDRDTDLVLLKSDQLLVLENNRMWQYKTHQLVNNEKLNLMATTFATDGSLDILLAKSGGDAIKQYNFNHVSNLLNLRNTFTVNEVQQFAVKDINADGTDELMVLSGNHFLVIDTENSEVLTDESFPQGMEKFQLISTENGPEVLLFGQENTYQLKASNHRGPFLSLLFSGAHLESDSMRSNTLGIGTEFTVFKGQFAKKHLFASNTQLNQQSYQPINVAAFGKSIDFMRMEWSDGVMQTELELSSGKIHHIVEKQRQLSSCPVLFVKQDQGFKFITDVLGVGGLGFAVGKQQYAEPRPWENLLVTDYLNPKDDVFEFYITEPMEETAYIDQVALVAYDVPNGWQAVLDERMATNATQATGEVKFYQREIHPVKVVDSSNNADTTAMNSAIDGKAMPVGQLDRNFMGYLLKQQKHTFEFAETLTGKYRLIIHGWVEYGYSQTGFAAWQAGKKLTFPTVQMRVDGQWQTVLSEFGYPAGMPKYASIEFDSFNQSFDAIRISTNQEVYFDQVKLAEVVPQPATLKFNLPMTGADLKTIGFPERKDEANRYPSYDFSNKQPFWDTRYMSGNYTKLGDVLPLIEHSDNALTILGAGEGIRFAFDNDLPNLQPGYHRIFVLEFKGWAKDMDLLTQNGESVGPMPINGDLSDAANQLNTRYNVRYLSGE